MTWFPHEPIDAVTCYIRYSRVIELGNTGDKGPSHSSTAQETALTESRERSEVEAAFLKKRWIQWHEVQLQDNPWQMEQRVLTRLRNVFKLVQKIGMMWTFRGQKFRWMKESQSGRCIEVSQQKAIDELEEIL